MGGWSMRKTILFWLITLLGLPILVLGIVCAVVSILWRAGWNIGADAYTRLGAD